jgi:3-deoxy-alpha-D-manno-octulosonate 8-oxidase
MKPLANRSVQFLHFGTNQSALLQERVDLRRKEVSGPVVWIVDSVFKSIELKVNLPKFDSDIWIWADTQSEPTVELVDQYSEIVRYSELPAAIVGVGGGSTLDLAKAVANLQTNSGLAADYQGWDLVQKAAPWKIGIPTLSGTGSEGSRTCVLTNASKGLKLGMNSPHTVFDELVLDPDLTETVPRDQYLYTGMDTYIHCIESLAGSYRHALSDAWSREALALCRQVFSSKDMQSSDSREKLMVASLLGGMAIGNSLVGLVHPFSAGLSMVHHTRHGVSNCIALKGLAEYYPEAASEMVGFLKKQQIEIPTKINTKVSEEEFEQLRNSTVIHEKPLANALGDNWLQELTDTKIQELFAGM